MTTTNAVSVVPWQHSEQHRKPCKIEFDLSGYTPAARAAAREELQLPGYKPLVTRVWLHKGTLFVKVNTEEVSGAQRLALIRERADLLARNVIPIALRKGVQLPQRRKRNRTRAGIPIPAQPQRSPAFAR